MLLDWIFTDRQPDRLVVSLRLVSVSLKESKSCRWSSSSERSSSVAIWDSYLYSQHLHRCHTNILGHPLKGLQIHIHTPGCILLQWSLPHLLPVKELGACSVTCSIDLSVGRIGSSWHLAAVLRPVIFVGNSMQPVGELQWPSSAWEHLNFSFQEHHVIVEVTRRHCYLCPHKAAPLAGGALHTSLTLQSRKVW